MTHTTHTDRLVDFIARHGFSARVTEDGAIEALALWTDGMGHAGESWERIEPTLEAVRDWLGY